MVLTQTNPTLWFQLSTLPYVGTLFPSRAIRRSLMSDEYLLHHHISLFSTRRTLLFLEFARTKLLFFSVLHFFNAHAVVPHIDVATVRPVNVWARLFAAVFASKDNFLAVRQRALPGHPCPGHRSTRGVTFLVYCASSREPKAPRALLVCLSGYFGGERPARVTECFRRTVTCHRNRDD